jgi:hypothetical protein
MIYNVKTPGERLDAWGWRGISLVGQGIEEKKEKNLKKKLASQ